MKKVILKFALACCLFVGRVVADEAPQRDDELRYNGDEGNIQQLQQPTSPVNQRARQRVPSGLSQDLIAPFGYANGFSGGFDGGFGASGQFDVVGDLLGAMPRWRPFLGNLLNPIPQQLQQFEREFEGQDVSYFNRNGVAFVRTCTTERVAPGQEVSIEDRRELPYNRQKSLLEQQPQQHKSHEQAPPTLTQEQPASDVPANT